MWSHAVSATMTTTPPTCAPRQFRPFTFPQTFHVGAVIEQHVLDMSFVYSLLMFAFKNEPLLEKYDCYVETQPKP